MWGLTEGIIIFKYWTFQLNKGLSIRLKQGERIHVVESRGTVNVGIYSKINGACLEFAAWIHWKVR